TLIWPDQRTGFENFFITVKNTYLKLDPSVTGCFLKRNAKFEITVGQRFCLDLLAFMMKIYIGICLSFDPKHSDHRLCVPEFCFLKIILFTVGWFKDMSHYNQFIFIGITAI